MEEKPFIAHDNIATSGGCLAAQYIAGWVIEKKADKAWKELVLKSIQPVGEGLSFSDATELVNYAGTGHPLAFGVQVRRTNRSRRRTMQLFILRH